MDQQTFSVHDADTLAEQACLAAGANHATGELGYYVRRLTLEGLIAFVVSNIAGSPGGRREPDRLQFPKPSCLPAWQHATLPIHHLS